MLSLENIVIYRDDKPLLQLSAEVAKGEVLTVMGPSDHNAINWLYDRLVHACSCNEKTK